jgi:uncharacterized membrane protein
MELSPEERRRIYEEEKERIEREQREAQAVAVSAQLPQNVTGLLCYLAGWVTGIVFLVLEPRNRFVRFHALQSIITFAVLTVAGVVLSFIPLVGSAFSALVFTLGFVLWIILMIKAYQGEMFKLPLAGDIALAAINGAAQAEQAAPEQEPAPAAQPSPLTARFWEEVGNNIKKDESSRRTLRIVGYSFGIIWAVLVMVFLSFFHRYIAWYSLQPGGHYTRYPLLTSAYMEWLPILIVTGILSIAAHVLLIIYDKYWFRKTAEIAISLLGIVLVVSLIAIFPFDFSVIPVASAGTISAVVKACLILLIIMLVISILERVIRLVLYAVRR